MAEERGRSGPVLLAWADSPAPRETGRRLLSSLVSELVPGAAVSFTSVCARCGADHGPPVAVGLPVSVSVSYAGSLVVAGAVHDRDAAALGIDVEPAPHGPDRTLTDLAALFAPHPPPDLRGWTMIEAVLKADGRGLRVPPGEVVFGMPGAGVARGTPASVLGEAARTASVPGRIAPFDVVVADGPDGYVVSVAVLPV